MSPMAVPALLLHPAAQIGWTSWTVHWSTVVGLGVIAVLYELGARNGGRWPVAGRRDGTLPPPGSPSAATVASGPGHRPPATDHRPSGGQRLSFYVALLFVFISLNGPLHDLSDYYLFSAHMVQHLVLALVFPPLLLLGIPGGMLRPVLLAPRVAPVARRLTRPVACFVIFNVTVAAWHLPPLYNLALAIHPVHILQHLMFMGAAVLMWWPILSRVPELPRLAYPGQMLYCFLMVIPMSIVSIYIALADSILYPAYAAAPRLWGIAPMQDQQLGGLIMWVPGGLFFYGVMTVVFFKWAGRGVDDTAGAQVDWKPVT